MVKERKLRGSITVEVAFLFPIILFIIMAFIYFTFYLHDQTVVTCVIDEANERLNQAVRQPTNFETGVIYYDKMTSQSLLCRYNGDYSVEIANAKKYIKEQLEKKLMLGKVTNIEVTKEKGVIKTEVKMKNQIKLLPAVTYLKQYQQSKNTAECEVNNTSEYVRAASVTLDVVSQTKAFDKIVKVINKIDHILG